MRHLQMLSFLAPSEMNEFLDLLPAQQRIDEVNWYRGTGPDAVLPKLRIPARGQSTIYDCSQVTLYKMDDSKMLPIRSTGAADGTVAVSRCRLEEAADSAFMACR